MSRTLRRAVGAVLLTAACGLLAGNWAASALRQPPPVRAAFAASCRDRSVPEVPFPDGTVDVNSADLYELTELYGVGETLAQAIIDEREAHGPFFYPEDLMAARGIGSKKLAGFRGMLDMSQPGEGSEETEISEDTKEPEEAREAEGDSKKLPSIPPRRKTD